MMQADATITITLPARAWSVALGGVAKLPWEIADPLMQEIQRQAAEQMSPSDHRPADGPSRDARDA